MVFVAWSKVFAVKWYLEFAFWLAFGNFFSLTA